MAVKQKTHGQIRTDLEKYLMESFPSMEIDARVSDRWKRLCLTFRWDGFAGLLPEERFARLIKHVPVEFLEKHCGDAVWVELAADESVEDYLALPRSEDVDSKLDAILKKLEQMNFFAMLEDELVRVPLSQTSDDFQHTRRTLAGLKVKPAFVADVCLAFMRHKAYSDWEALREVRPSPEGKKKTKKAPPGKGPSPKELQKAK